MRGMEGEVSPRGGKSRVGMLDDEGGAGEAGAASSSSRCFQCFLCTPSDFSSNARWSHFLQANFLYPRLTRIDQ